jgi:hypothetical protein
LVEVVTSFGCHAWSVSRTIAEQIGSGITIISVAHLPIPKYKLRPFVNIVIFRF